MAGTINAAPWTISSGDTRPATVIEADQTWTRTCRRSDFVNCWSVDLETGAAQRVLPPWSWPATETYTISMIPGCALVLWRQRWYGDRNTDGIDVVIPSSPTSAVALDAVLELGQLPSSAKIGLTKVISSFPPAARRVLSDRGVATEAMLAITAVRAERMLERQMLQAVS